jgi:hypothetical protein
MKYNIAYIQIDVDTASGMWAPVIVEYIEENIFKVTNRGPVNIKQFGNWKEVVDENIYDPDFEEWEYPPGTVVRCEWFVSDYGIALRAVEKVDFQVVD